MPEIEGCKSSVKSFPFSNDLSIAAEVLHEIEPNVSQITPKSTNFMTRILERSESCSFRRAQNNTYTLRITQLLIMTNMPTTFKLNHRFFLFLETKLLFVLNCLLML